MRTGQQAMRFASNSNENEFVSLTIRKKCNVFKNIFKKRAIIGKHARSEAIQPFWLFFLRCFSWTKAKYKWGSKRRAMVTRSILRCFLSGRQLFRQLEAQTARQKPTLGILKNTGSCSSLCCCEQSLRLCLNAKYVRRWVNTRRDLRRERKSFQAKLAREREKAIAVIKSHARENCRRNKDNLQE